MVRDLTGVDAEAAARALAAGGNDIPHAVLIAHGAPPDAAVTLPLADNGKLRTTLATSPPHYVGLPSDDHEPRPICATASIAALTCKIRGSCSSNRTPP